VRELICGNEIEMEMEMEIEGDVMSNKTIRPTVGGNNSVSILTKTY
jgi:hypothetical protein